MESPTRKWLRHGTPSWVSLSDEIYFITVCSKDRCADTLTKNDVPQQLIESIRFRENRNIWHPFIFLIMPDHAHAIVRIGTESKGLTRELKDWKSWTARTIGISWQSGFFDHRLRDKRSLFEKYEYILQNPARAGLVHNADDWKWKLTNDYR